MSIAEAVLWVSLGFAPTLAAMTFAWNMALKKTSRSVAAGVAH